MKMAYSKSQNQINQANVLPHLLSPQKIDGYLAVKNPSKSFHGVEKHQSSYPTHRKKIVQLGDDLNQINDKIATRSCENSNTPITPQGDHAAHANVGKFHGAQRVEGQPFRLSSPQLHKKINPNELFVPLIHDGSRRMSTHLNSKSYKAGGTRSQHQSPKTKPFFKHEINLLTTPKSVESNEQDDIPKINIVNADSRDSNSSKRRRCQQFTKQGLPENISVRSNRSESKNKQKTDTKMLSPLRSGIFQNKMRSKSHRQEQKNHKVPSFVWKRQSQKKDRPKGEAELLRSTDKTGLKISKQDLRSTNVSGYCSQRQKKGNETEKEEFAFKINVKPAVKQWAADDFIILRQLGKGSFGSAFMAIEKKTGFVCVLKTIKKDSIGEFETNSFLREIKIQFFLNHPHLPALYGCFNDDEHLYLVMEALPSGNLRSQLKKKCEEKEVKVIISQIVSALTYMHSRFVIHRDIKPQNIFTFLDHYKLGDFGCSVHSSAPRDSFVGSPVYLCPEQLKNKKYDSRVDVWQIGTLTYQLLFGKCPFERDIINMMNGARTRELSQLKIPNNAKISPEARDFLCKTLQKEGVSRMNMIQTSKHPFIRDMLQGERDDI